VRRLTLVAIVVIGCFLFSIPSFAQEVIYPKAEVFGGFSISSAKMVSFDPTTFFPTVARNSFMGWQGSANYNLTHHLAIVGDFGGQYKSVTSVGANQYQFLFGPRVVFRGSRVTPFVHALFGEMRSTLGVVPSTTVLTITTPAATVSGSGFGMGLGGGLDINVSDRLALRVPQFDWMLMHVSSGTVTLPGVGSVTVPGIGGWSTSQVRIGIGLVIKAGGK
jgi:opacity protein-like surface antigen